MAVLRDGDGSLSPWEAVCGAELRGSRSLARHTSLRLPEALERVIRGKKGVGSLRETCDRDQQPIPELVGSLVPTSPHWRDGAAARHLSPSLS